LEVAGAGDDFATAGLMAAALTVDFLDLDFRLVMMGSPEKLRGPEGPPEQVAVERDGLARAPAGLPGLSAGLAALGRDNLRGYFTRQYNHYSAKAAEIKWLDVA
jgi:hypothetical protein